jgi:hypothetical protein
MATQWGATGLSGGTGTGTATSEYASEAVSQTILAAAAKWAQQGAPGGGTNADYEQLVAAFDQYGGKLPMGWAEPWAKAFGIPLYQKGTDYVPKTGLAYLHKGEKVIPAGQSSSTTTVTISPQITINSSGDASPKEIAKEVDNAIIQSLRYGKGRVAVQEIARSKR